LKRPRTGLRDRELQAALSYRSRSAVALIGSAECSGYRSTAGLIQRVSLPG
jgi:hypothetical protein